MIDISVDSFLQLFVQALLSSAECAQPTVRPGPNVGRRSCKWYDVDYQSARRDARKALSLFRKAGAKTDREQYVQFRNMYKDLSEKRKIDIMKPLVSLLSIT